MIRFNHIVQYLMIACLLVVAGCTTVKQSDPARTAEEEMLISTASDRAAAELALQIPPKTKVFLDTTNFEGTDSKYAIGAIRASLMLQDITMADDKKSADVVVEIRAGALSTDNKTTLVGIPSFAVPVPFASGSLNTPELAFYKDATQKGVAKFAATAYNGTKPIYPIAVQDLKYGFSHDTKFTVLLFISWEDNDAVPDEDKTDSHNVSLTNEKTSP